VELAPGDALILYTDGLTEARDAAGEQLDLSGVIPVVERTRGAEELKDALMEAARRHVAVQDDDITVLVVERT
jgi:sigma-B regulation protein RsbU (phosphoserine phosphatase)